jgi:hypothetical protein
MVVGMVGSMVVGMAGDNLSFLSRHFRRRRSRMEPLENNHLDRVRPDPRRYRIRRRMGGRMAVAALHFHYTCDLLRRRPLVVGRRVLLNPTRPFIVFDYTSILHFISAQAGNNVNNYGRGYGGAGWGWGAWWWVWIIIAILFLVAILAAGDRGRWRRRNTTVIERGEIPVDQRSAAQNWRNSIRKSPADLPVRPCPV